MIKPFDFYFDFVSPYSFLAHKQLKKIENKARVTKNIICFKSIFDWDSKNHSLINRNPTAIRMVKIRKIFCKYRMTKIHPTKSNAAGNL